jgi:hypothetical protein
VLRIFIALKNPSSWPGFEAATFGSSGQHTNHYTTKATATYPHIYKRNLGFCTVTFGMLTSPQTRVIFVKTPYRLDLEAISSSRNQIFNAANTKVGY